MEYIGQKPKAQNVFCVAVLGTTTRVTALYLSATTTNPATDGITTVSGWCLPFSSEKGMDFPFVNRFLSGKLSFANMAVALKKTELVKIKDYF